MRDKWAFVSEIIVEILNPESSAFCFSDNVDYLDATALHVAEVGDLFGASFPYMEKNLSTTGRAVYTGCHQLAQLCCFSRNRSTAPSFLPVLQRENEEDPIIIAVQRNDFKMVNILIQGGYSIYSCDQSQATPLEHALMKH